jgi:hypothetical protein
MPFLSFLTGEKKKEFHQGRDTSRKAGRKEGRKNSEKIRKNAERCKGRTLPALD